MLKPSFVVRTTALLALCGSSSALAQTQSSSSEPDTQADNSIAEIIVTAQRRAENLQDVPVAIVALSGEDLESRNVTTTVDLQLVTPSLSFNSGAGSLQPRLRGVGTQAVGPGIENPVATYVDNVYIAAMTSSLLALSNIAQVAVLKGPQGTLFGRNATGGVIQITTLEPRNEFSGMAEVRYGNHNTYGASLYATGGLTTNVAADISLYYNDISDGFGRNIVSGNRTATERNFTARSKVRWDVSDDTTFKLLADYSKLNQDGPSYRPIYGTVSSNNYFYNGGVFDIASDIDPRLSTEQGGVSAELSHQLGSVKLLSISAYRKSRYTLLLDNDRTPAHITIVDAVQKDEQFSQELQIASDSSANFNWVLGGYYFESDAKYDPFDIRPGNPAIRRIETLSRQTAKSLAGFAQADLKITSATTLTAGVRYTDEVRRYDATVTRFLSNGAVLPSGSTQGNRLHFAKLTWRLALSHQFSDDVLGYISANRGARSGLFNPSSALASSVQPEVLDAYEVGIKSDLFDRRVRINASGFYYDYSDLQVSRFDNGVASFTNADGARIYGGELDATVRAGSNLTLTGGVSIMRSEFLSFPAAPTNTPLPGGGNRTTSVDAKGNSLPKSPDFTLSLSANYRVPLNFGWLELDANYYHNGGYFSEPDNLLRQAAYDVVGGGITLSSPDESMYAKVWARNLFNEAYSIAQSTNVNGTSIWLAQGRSYGITAGVKF